MTMARLYVLWKEYLDLIEQRFLEGELSDEDTKKKLRQIFPESDVWEDMWSALYDMRKHGYHYNESGMTPVWNEETSDDNG